MNAQTTRPRARSQRTLKRVSAWLLVTLTAFAGCVPCLNAIYTAGDVEFDEALLGSWSPAQNNETWVFTKEGEKGYRLVFTDRDSKIGVFEATLAKVDGARFLDLAPLEEPDLAQNALWKYHLIPAHTFLLVESTSPTFKMRAMNPNWAAEYLRNHPDELAHTFQDDRLIVTAKSEDIQKFATRHIGTPEAYGDVYELTKNQ